MLTDRLRRRLSREAEKLALEVVAGTAPRIGTGAEFRNRKPCCSMRHVAYRAGLRQPRDRYEFNPIHSALLEVSQPGFSIWGDVARANDGGYAEHLPWALLFLSGALAPEADRPRAAPHKAATPNTREGD